MTRVEVTDEIVARFRTAQQRLYGKCVCNDDARSILEAALNPPAEPEIVVTHEMRKVGHANLLSSLAANYADLGEIYRAMRRLEPKP